MRLTPQQAEDELLRRFTDNFLEWVIANKQDSTENWNEIIEEYKTKHQGTSPFNTPKT